MRSETRAALAAARLVDHVEVYVPQLDVDNLPTRIHDPHRQCRLVPEGRPPKAIRGLRLDELATLIRRCGLEGAWRQGSSRETCSSATNSSSTRRNRPHGPRECVRRRLTRGSVPPDAPASNGRERSCITPIRAGIPRPHGL